MVVETPVSWGKGAAKVIKRLVQALMRATYQVDWEVVKHLFGKLSTLLQRDISSLILNRVPLNPESIFSGDF